MAADDRSAVLHYLQWWLPPSEQFVHGLVSRSRHRPVIVARDELFRPDRFPVPRLYCLGPVMRRAPASQTRRVLTAGLAAVALRHRVRLIHVHFGYRVHDVVGLSRRLHIPFVVTLLGHDITAFLHDRPGFYRDVLPHAGAVIVPSQWFVQYAVAAGAPLERVRVLPLGVDMAAFEPSAVPIEPEVLFVGRFVEKKGLDTLLASWPAVQRQVPAARLTVMGYGPLEQTVRAGAVGSAVDVIVDPDRAAVLDAMRRARVVVSPSHTAGDGDVESLLVVNLEAQAAGRPVVTTDHGPIPEFVRDGETALVVPERNAGELGAALVRVLSDDALAARLGAGGPAWVERFELSRCAAALDQLYDEQVGLQVAQEP